ncbi:hypothetical protein SUGI_0320030 [Cryptomeria japonica]|nr:hypothetical protein SUGI_0320030 [Cryptomeria japonica]
MFSEALELECLSAEEIIKGVSGTLVIFNVRGNGDGKNNIVNNDTNGCISEIEGKKKINGFFNTITG